MITKKAIISGLLVFLLSAAFGQQEEHFVLLPESEASSLAKMYPKNGPEKIDGSWQPSKSEIDALEANLSHISELKSFGAPRGESIPHPEKYFRQYVAVIRAEHRLIYINAFCDVRDISYWHDHLAIVMDGGNCFWQAWYDPATSKFSGLSVNGRA